jgi:hypothetical protein
MLILIKQKVMFGRKTPVLISIKQKGMFGRKNACANFNKTKGYVWMKKNACFLRSGRIAS